VKVPLLDLKPQYRALKAELDAALAERFGVGVDELGPWHYSDPFFQDPPPPADDPLLDDPLVGLEPIRCQEIGDDGVVVAGVERDLSGASHLGDGAHDVERPVPIERRDLDRHGIRNRGQAMPEGAREHSPADRRLQVEADQRNLARDAVAVLDELGDRSVAKRAQREQSRVVPEVVR